MTQSNAAELRVRLKGLRKHFAVADRQRASLLIRARLYTWLAVASDHCQRNNRPAPRIIAAFWPLPDEPDLIPLLSQWTEAGLTVALPRMQSAAAPLQFHAWLEKTALIAGAFGVMEPPAGEALLADVVLVPTLGFTTRGDRLGYGKGFYDRTLAHYKTIGHQPTTIGVAWACGDIEPIDPAYDPEPHDQRLDAIITPEAWYPASPALKLTDASKA